MAVLSKKMTGLSVDGSSDEGVATDSTLDHDSPPRYTPSSSSLYRPTYASSLSPINMELTQAIKLTASCMSTGEMLHDNSFVLFEAMCALQIMDPKMDGAYNKQKDKEPEFDVLQELSPEQCLGIMDELFCFEMAWQRGFDLSRTLFLSRYINRLLCTNPQTIEDAVFDEYWAGGGNYLVHLVLRTYCIMLLKTCDLVREVIVSPEVQFYEDEDFSSETYRRDLLTKIDTDPALEDLFKQAIDYIDMQSSNQGPHRTECFNAIATRLQWRKGFLDTVWTDGTVEWGSSISWQNLLEGTERIDQTAHLGRQVPNAYSKNLRLNLTSSSPPRDPVLLPFSDALLTCVQLCALGAHLHGSEALTTPDEILPWIQFIADESRPPPIYILCLAQNILWQDSLFLRRWSIREAIFLSLESTVLPSCNLLARENAAIEAPQDSRFKINQYMQAFCHRVEDVYIETHLSFCMNHPRIHRQLNKLIRRWDAVQIDAIETDRQLYQYSDFQDRGRTSSERPYQSLTTWVARQKYRLMSHHIRLGFELDLYRPNERSSMYLLLASFASSQVHNLICAQAAVYRRRNELRPQISAKVAKFTRVLDVLDAEICEAYAVHHLAMALSHIYTFLTLLGVVSEPFEGVHSPFSYPELRYMHRMKPYMSVRDPPIPTYEEMTRLVTLQEPISEEHDETELQVLEADAHTQALAILGLAAAESKIAMEKWQAYRKKPNYDTRTTECAGAWLEGVRKGVRSCASLSLTLRDSQAAIEKMEDQSVAAMCDLLEVKVSAAIKGSPWLVPGIKVRPEGSVPKQNGHAQAQSGHGQMQNGTPASGANAKTKKRAKAKAEAKERARAEKAEAGASVTQL